MYALGETIPCHMYTAINYIPCNDISVIISNKSIYYKLLFNTGSVRTGHFFCRASIQTISRKNVSRYKSGIFG